MRTREVSGVEYILVGDTTRIDSGEFITVGIAKDGDGERIAVRGTYDECADYADRNESQDNYESYRIGKVVT